MPLAFRLALSYAAFFFFIGLLMPWWPVWLQSRGLDAVEIGILIAAGRWAVVLTSPLAAQIADRTGERRRMLILLSAGVAGAYFLFGTIDLLWQFFAVTLIASILQGPVMPLNDSITMAHMRRSEVDYGRVRLWGSIAFIAASLAGGFLLEGRSEDVILWAVTAGSCLVVAAFWFLPGTKPTPSKRRFGDGLRLAANPIFLLFLLTVGLIQSSHTVVYAFGSIHWRAAGLSDTVIGVLWAISVFAEVVLFAFGTYLVRRLGPGGLLLLGAAAGVVRWCLTGLSSDLWVLVPCQLLHALTFGATHLGGMALIARAAPPDQTATAQSLYSALAMSASFAICLPLVALLFESWGGDTFYVMAGLSLGGAVTALLLMRVWRGEGIKLA